MAELKTKPNDVSVTDFINQIENPRKREEALQLLTIFEEVTGVNAQMWGESIIGFGSYHYKYASGHEGDAAIVGFSPRKAKTSLYIYLPEEEKEAWQKKLGKVTAGVACIYVNKLADIDQEVLKEMIKVGWKLIKELYPENEPGG